MEQRDSGRDQTAFGVKADFINEHRQLIRSTIRLAWTLSMQTLLVPHIALAGIC